MLGFAHAGQVGTPGLISRHTVKDCGLFRPIKIVGRRYRLCSGNAVRHGFRNCNQPVEIGKVERMQQHRVHGAEHGGICAHAERESNDSDNRETRALAQHAQTVANVLEQGLEHVHASRFAAFFLYAFHPAKFDLRLPAGLFRAHAVADVVGRPLFQVKAQFRIKLTFGLLFAKKPVKPVHRNLLLCCT